MSHYKTIRKRKQRIFSAAIFATMWLAIFVLAAFAQKSLRCRSKLIINKNPVGFKAFYTLSDGRGVWADNKYRVGDNYCQH